MTTTAATEEFSISENGRREMTKALECMTEAEDALEQIWFGEGLRDAESQSLDREIRWLVSGFTEDAQMYVESLVRTVILMREKVNGGLVDRDLALLDLVGRV